MVSTEILLSAPYREINHPEIATIRVYPTEKETAKAAASVIAGLVEGNPTARITYATGNTMIPVYGELYLLAERGRASFKKTTAFHLDEYVSASPQDEWGFVNFLRRRVFGPLYIENVNEINGQAVNPAEEAARYDRLLNAAPIDLAILGIGPGGHIAFNEPGTPFSLQTHITHLSASTVNRDRIERGQKTPERALTQGIANIKSAENILLVAYGKEKGTWLADALGGTIGPNVPASALREVGEKVRIFVDEAAATELEIYNFDSTLF